MDRQLPLRTVIAAIEHAYPGDSPSRLFEAASIGADWLQVNRLLDYFVGRPRQAGLYWAEIGAHLGVSRQAAQQRFATRIGRRTATAGPAHGARS
ncbi:hypothetical protein [Nocardia grenadensis]|uniref:hypothetical protein n=1 Tax=Nocardia grenadensis TaxID=931537 RepID=UPI0007A3A86F|nr:hypothetical protein [Nocardia grenadensis]